MPFRAAVIAGLFRWSRRCRSKTRQQWLVGYIYHYLYSHCNLFLVHSGEKSASTLPDPYIMNSQSRSRTAPPPFLALNSREWRGLTYASVEEADHHCWLVVVSNIVFFRIFSVEYSNMYNLSINELCTSILRGNLYICPHNCIVCVRMVISFYPATRIHVHFSHEVRSFCATCASFRRWPGPVVWAFLTVAYRWSRWNRSSCPSLSSLLRSKFYVNLNLLGTSVSSLHQWHHLRYQFATKCFSQNL